MGIADICPYCTRNTLGQHEHGCPNAPRLGRQYRTYVGDVMPMVGWVCPRCQRVLSPFTVVCPCSRPPAALAEEDFSAGLEMDGL
jgi:hypothetical protein